MKKNMHPELKKAQVKCACGHAFETLSTRESIRVEICAKCHPVFTGKAKVRDSAGRIEKFEKKYGRKKAQKEEAAE